MEPEGPYTRSWQLYKRWYFASVAVFVGYLPTFALLSALFPGFLEGSVAPFVIFLVYAGTWVATSNVARRWRCPRCRERFFGSPWLLQWPMAFVSKCRYCGLPKYAEADPTPAA